MYKALENIIVYCHPDTYKSELFITIHQTESTLSINEQAIVIAELLNKYTQ